MERAFPKDFPRNSDKCILNFSNSDWFSLLLFLWEVSFCASILDKFYPFSWEGVKVAPKWGPLFTKIHVPPGKEMVEGAGCFLEEEGLEVLRR